MIEPSPPPFADRPSKEPRATHAKAYTIFAAAALALTITAVFLRDFSAARRTPAAEIPLVSAGEDLRRAKQAEDAMRARALLADGYGAAESPCEGHMTVVREKGFAGAALPPKPVSEVLTEISGAKKRPAVPLRESDFSKVVVSPSLNPPESRISLKTAVPGPTNPLPSAPVSAKVFSDGRSYAAFRASHPGSRLPDADFSRQMVVMLVSTSDFPNRIFQAVEARETKGKLVVQYRVNAFAAAQDEDDYYSAIAAMKSKLPVELRQIR